MENERALLARKTLFASDHAATMVNRYDLYGENTPHGHDFFEIALSAGGKGRHVSASGEQMLNEGEVIIVRPGAWHGYMECSGLIIYNCCFDQNLLQRELSWLREDSALNYLMWTGPYASDRRGVLVVRLQAGCLNGCLEQLQALGDVQDSPRRAETLGRLLIFLDSLSRTVEECGVLHRQAQHIHPAVIETMHLIESQISRDWSLTDLGTHCHLNPSYLVRLFKADVGLSPIAYLNRCRLERAAGLMLHTVLPVAEVAAQLGWFDPNLFARRFRAAYGMSPSEYRKRFGGKADDPAAQIIHGGRWALP